MESIEGLSTFYSLSMSIYDDLLMGFDDWELYRDFYFTKLERGSKEYNTLIIKYWDQVLKIVEKLGTYIQENKIKLLYLINICSNPGNASLTLAVVLLSEFLGIPVVNNNHDFFWEEGKRPVEERAREEVKALLVDTNISLCILINTCRIILEGMVSNVPSQ